MLYAFIKNNESKKAIQIDIPYNKVEITQDLASVGIWIPTGNIYIRDNVKDKASVKLLSKSTIGDNLIRLFSEDYDLSTVNILCDLLVNLHEDRLDEINKDIQKGKYENARELMVSVINTEIANKKVITHTFNLYCPLVVQIEEIEDYSLEECDNYYGVVYEDKIRDALLKHMVCGNKKDMAEYFHGSQSIRNKVVTAKWDVEKVDGDLYGCIHTGVTEPLTKEEMIEWKAYVLGQNSDGLGESFEQRPIATNEYDLFISFWNGGPDYFIYEKEEFVEYLNSQKGGNDIMNYSRDRVNAVKSLYPVGTRIELIELCNDEKGMPKGLRGTVVGVDDQPALLMNWDNNRTLSILIGDDRVRKLTLQEIDEENIEQQQSLDNIT